MKAIHTVSSALCILLACTVLHAGADDAVENSTSDSWVTGTLSWLERQQATLSRGVSGASSGLDQYIARDSFDSDLVSKSYVQIRFNHEISSGRPNETRGTIKTRLDLPNSKNKLSVFLDSDPDELDSIDDRQRNVTGDTVDNRDEDMVAGLSLLNKVQEQWDSDLRFGVRVRWPLDPYSKASISRSDQLSEQWRSRLKFSGSYFDSRGWRADSRWDVYMPLDKRDTFRIINEAQFIDADNEWEFYHGYSFYRRFTKSSLEYRFSVSGSSEPNPRVTGYGFRMPWRRKLNRDWLYFKVTPEVTFPRDRGFSDTWAIYFGLEVFFSEHYIEKL
ncbi:hypothetical protein [Pseudomaricurvus sp. HS19]|uniref:hypothetical protein n=1 Tax=Pseudomaricurvus sp. HS19 TaxID=2692626 RepID=UPI00136AE4EA|nr:hypothetical protein [Pseudomaricurvus sp. HS19]MYM63898.1 hypothetical protein [Pseudomaricurvus sp. HS19]